MFHYAEYSISKGSWYVYQETEFDLPRTVEGPYSKEKAHKRAKELNEEHNS